VILFALLDLYTVHVVAIPYYTGMIRHRANGAIEALHLSGFERIGFTGTFERLTAFKSATISPPLLIVLWIAYLLATFWLVAASLPRFNTPDAKIELPPHVPPPHATARVHGETGPG
jgi:hypothetical protein